MLDGFAHALASAHLLRTYHSQIQALPAKDYYPVAEFEQALWQVWTNQMALPNQVAYASGDIKKALARPFIGNNQEACSRATLELAVRRITGCPEKVDRTWAAFGFLSMLVGAFLLGGATLPGKTVALKVS